MRIVRRFFAFVLLLAVVAGIVYYFAGRAAGAIDRDVEHPGLTDHRRHIDRDRRAAGPSGKVIREGGDDGE